MTKLNCRITGRRLLCRYPVTEDTLSGGRVILLDASKRSITQQQGMIEQAGPGDYDEEGAFTPTDPHLAPGTWILHAPWKRVPTWDDELFLLHEDDVLAYFELP